MDGVEERGGGAEMWWMLCLGEEDRAAGEHSDGSGDRNGGTQGGPERRFEVCRSLGFMTGFVAIVAVVAKGGAEERCRKEKLAYPRYQVGVCMDMCMRVCASR